jgi:hypothetical protein
MLVGPDVTLSVRLSKSVYEQLERLAADYDVTPGQIIRDALGKFIEGLKTPGGPTPLRSANTDEVELCRVAIADALSSATTWGEMQVALASRGYRYVAQGGGLAVYSSREGCYLCKASEAGPGYSSLIKHFKAAFPGHPHAWLATRILGEDQ